MILMEDCQSSSLSSCPRAASAPKLQLKPLKTRRWPEQNQCQLVFRVFRILIIPPTRFDCLKPGCQAGLPKD